jgi:hypothetical protein
VVMLLFARVCQLCCELTGSALFSKKGYQENRAGT